MPEKSSSSVQVFSVDRKRTEDLITRWAADVRREHPEIECIYWFGSWIGGTPTPGSDVDICIVVSESEKDPRDRTVDYRPLLPVAMDLLVYTHDEFDRLAAENAPIIREVLRGRRL